MVDASDASNIKMIFAVLGPFSLACRFETTGLSLKKKIHAEYCYCPKVFLDMLGGSYSGNWTLYIA